MRLLDIVAAATASLAEMRDALPAACQHAGAALRLPGGAQVRGVERGQGAAWPAEGAEVNDIDGVRVSTPDGWWLLRASNTQAVLVARCRGQPPEGLERLKATVREQLGRVGVAAPAGF